MSAGPVDRGDPGGAHIALAAIELVRVRLPLRRSLRAAHGPEASFRDVVLVRAIGVGGGEGWGECSALESPTYSDEHTEAAWAVLRDELAPAALAGRPAVLAGHPFASSAVRMARVDLARRQATAAVDPASAPGGAAWTAVLGIPDDLDSLLDQVAEARAAGASALKLKVRPDDGERWLGEVVAAAPDLPVALDANGSFGGLEGRLVGLAEVLSAAAGPGDARAYIEQPLPADDLEAHARLAPRLAVPIALDESIRTAADIDRVRDLGVGVMVNVKPARIEGLAWWTGGGSAAGPACFLGGMVETGVGRSGALSIGAALGLGVTDLGPSTWYFDDDVTEPLVLGSDARMQPAPGPGVTLHPRPERLAQVAIDRVVVRP